MKSNAWLLLIIRSIDPVKTLRVERRTTILLAVGGIVFAGALAFFGYQYFTLLEEKARLVGQIGDLRNQVFTLRQTMAKIGPQALKGGPAPPPVTVEKLEAIRDPKRGGVIVKFRLVRQSGQTTPFSGTLAIVAKNETVQPPVYRVHPEMPLEKGIPRNPEKGQLFEVKGESPVETNFLGTPGESYQTLTVYLYSKGGKIIQQKSTRIPTL